MKRARLVAVATTSIPDPRVNPSHRRRDGHALSIVVSQYLDSDGIAWQRYADEPWERLGAPGEGEQVNEKMRRAKVNPKPRR